MSEDREKKNAVFQATHPDVQPGIPTVTAYDKVKAEFGLDVPLELVPLPSCGKVYPASSPVHGLEAVEIRSMTTREENILMSPALLKKGTVITELIKACLHDRRVDVLDLLSGDRNALMVAIRVTGYGPDYKTELTCPSCGFKDPEHEFDLAALEVRRLEIDPVVPGSNLFEFLLPKTGKRVRFKFMTGRDEEEMAATAAKQKKIGLTTDASVTTSLQYAIVSVDGIDDRAKLANFVQMMPARDSLALRNYMKANEPGIKMRQEMTCKSCEHSEEVAIPLGVAFLWPAAV